MFSLAVDDYTVLLAAGMAILWAWSLRLSHRAGRVGWTGVITSLFGFAWLGYGGDFVLRFLVLVWDAQTYEVSPVPMWSILPYTINKALALAGLYWAALCAGYAVGVRRRGPGPFALFRSLDTWDRSVLNGFAASSLYCTLIAGSQHLELSVPKGLVTPLGMIAALWPIPAAVEWAGYFEAQRRRISGGAWRWIYMIPGVAYVLVVPYRERMLQLLLVPIIAAFGAKKRLAPIPLAAGLIVILMVSTVTMSLWRRVLWEGESWREPTAFLDPENWEAGVEKPPWVALLQRFHSFDSLVLTAEYVPAALPFDERNVFLRPLLDMVPRLIYPGKPAESRSEEFSLKMWRRELPHETSPSKIAPSMPGDLYWSGGVLYVLAGAGLWGLLIGAYEGWKDRLPPLPARVLQSFLFMFFFLSVERDFAFVVSATLQGTVALLVVTAVLTGGPWLGSRK